jgi:hypothetical protein
MKRLQNPISMHNIFILGSNLFFCFSDSDEIATSKGASKTHDSGSLRVEKSRFLSKFSFANFFLLIDRCHLEPFISFVNEAKQ